MGPLLTTSLTRDYVHRRRVGLAKPRVWPRKVKQTNGHGAIAQMSPVIQRDPRHPVDLSVRFFLIPPSPPKTLQSSFLLLSNLKFHPPEWILYKHTSRSGTNRRRRHCVRGWRSAVFRNWLFDWRTSTAGSTATSRTFRWQIAANDKKQRVRRTIGKIMGRLFRIVVFVCFSRERSATSIHVC